jgi:hypothetical protein
MANSVSRRLLLDLAEECDDIADDLVRSRFCGASLGLGYLAELMSARAVIRCDGGALFYTHDHSETGSAGVR